MLKIIKILSSNIIILTVIIVLSSIYTDKNINSFHNINYMNAHSRIDESKINIKKYDTEKNNVIRLKQTDKEFKKFCGEERIKYGEEYKNLPPIVLLGCSYAYGHGLKTEETFSYKLSKITQRPVYNFSGCGISGMESFGSLKVFISENEANREIIKNAEFVIYLYMHDHINRYLELSFLYNSYKEIFPPKNKFEETLISIPLIRLICAVNKIRQISAGGCKNIKYINKFINKSEQYLKRIIGIINDEIHQYSPKAKFIIILYDEKISEDTGNLKIMYDSEILNSRIWQELKDENNIEIIHTKDITGFVFDKDYKLKEDISEWHPNEKVWDIFTPKFAKKYIN